MMRSLPLLALLGCAFTPLADERTVRLVLTADIGKECGRDALALESFGCAKLHGHDCTIVATRPRGFYDDERIKTLGHELWHCFTGPLHQ